MNFEKLGKIEGYMQELVEAKEMAGINLLILKQGREQCYLETGWADISCGKPLKRDTIFRLYSMTKPITSAAVMLLMEEGRIDLLEPVSKYISSFKEQFLLQDGKKIPVSRQATIADLLSMTSGLTYGGEDEAGRITAALLEEAEHSMTTQEMASRAGACPLAFVPGTHFAYGLSADVLGAIIEKVSDMELGVFLQEKFFDPLGMKDTGFYVPPLKQERLSAVYSSCDGALLPYRGNRLGIMNQMDRKPTFESGGAGLASTIDDYSHFTRMLLQRGNFEGKQILGPKTVEYMTARKLNPSAQADFEMRQGMEGYSYGNLMRIAAEPERIPFQASKGEYGWDGWLGAYFTNLPQEDMTILMMMQRTDTGMAYFTRTLRNMIAGALE